MNKAEILVIDDEASIRKLLEITLNTHDYKVILAQTGKEGIQLAVNHSPDLIILDLGLPDKNGHELLKELREWYTKGILILSVQNSEKDIVQALDNGANDYLTKPFRNAELLARIRSILRRNQSVKESSCLSSGELVLDLVSRTVKCNQELIKLTSTEYALLTLLMKNEGCVLTHQYILKEIWE